MFKDSFMKADKGKGRKSISILTSLFVHVLILLIVLVVPLLSTKNLPAIKVYSAFLAPPPPPPPPPAKKHKSSKRRTRIKPVRSQTNIEPGKLVAPVQIPEEIAEEELSDIGIEGGVEGGVEGE